MRAKIISLRTNSVWFIYLTPSQDNQKQFRLFEIPVIRQDPTLERFGGGKVFSYISLTHASTYRINIDEVVGIHFNNTRV